MENCNLAIADCFEAIQLRFQGYDAKSIKSITITPKRGDYGFRVKVELTAHIDVNMLDK